MSDAMPALGCLLGARAAALTSSGQPRHTQVGERHGKDTFLSFFKAYFEDVRSRGVVVCFFLKLI